MRVLWFSATPSLYGANNVEHNGGGWIASLEARLRHRSGVELGVAFEHPDGPRKVERDGVVYFPMPPVPVASRFPFPADRDYERRDEKIVSACLDAIEDFRPDVVQVFGSEWCYGLVGERTEVPVVIHMQGCIPPYNNALFPPGASFLQGILGNGPRLRRSWGEFLDRRHRSYLERREYLILGGCRHFLGRTRWDRSLTSLCSPGSTYHPCGEILREVFWESRGAWVPHAGRQRKRIASVLSGGLLKGHDLVLRTAALLRRFSSLDFEWRIFGTSDLRKAESLTGIQAQDVGVRAMGTLGEAALCRELLDTDLFFHSSYIDNSPNSVCEAQLLGMPVLATFVGGVPSLVEQDATGILIPANDPFQGAWEASRILGDPELARRLGAAAHQRAAMRHDPESIVDSLLEAYGAIASGSAR